MANYIDDGQTQDCFIAELSENGIVVYGGVEFTARMATAREVKIHTIRDEAQTDPEKSVDGQTKFILDHLVAWNIKNGKGNGVTLSAASIDRLHPSIYGSMYNIICGWRVSDAKPGQSDTTQKTDAELAGN